MKEITLREWVERGQKDKGYIYCSKVINDSGTIEINGCNRDWWVTTGNDLTNRSFCCTPSTVVVINL